MTLSEAEHKGLARALALLASGASSAFEYELWVVFGDRWTKVRASLASDGAIRAAPGGDWVVSASGEVLMRSLEEGRALSGAISGGEPGRDAPRAGRAGRPRTAVEGSSVV
jgi:hypothetical protein